MFNTIVVGAHKSESAKEAARTAIAFGRAQGAHVHLVAAYPGRSTTTVDTPERADAERTLEALAPPDATRFTTHALPEDPADAILRVANEVGADLIVVGNRRMQGPGRVLGSVANDVAHRAPCAVLILKTV